MVDRAIVRKPTEEDVEYLIEHIRPEDAAEIDALDGSTIRDSLNETPDLYNCSQVWEVDGKPVAIFGVTPQPGPYPTGVVWLLATSDFHKHTREFAGNCREIMKNMIKGYGYLFNYIHAENRVSIRWLKSLGFTILDGIPLGHKGAIFHKFEMKNV
jgi:hypothetical protein